MVGSTSAKSRRLSGLRLLIAEDDWLLAHQLAVNIEEEGGYALGPFSKAADALKCAAEEKIDFALVDMHLLDDFADRLLAQLTKRGVRYALVTGYSALPTNAYSDAVSVIPKPVDFEELIKFLECQAPLHPSA